MAKASNPGANTRAKNMARRIRDLQRDKVIDLSQGVSIGEQSAQMVQKRFYTYYIPFYGMKVVEEEGEEGQKKKFRYTGGFASRFVETEEPIASPEAVLSIQNQIMKEGEYTGVTLLAWVLITAQIRTVKADESTEQSGGLEMDDNDHARHDGGEEIQDGGSAI